MIPAPFTITTELLMIETGTALGQNVYVVVVRLAVISQELHRKVFTD